MDKEQFELLAATLPPEALAALKASMQEAGEVAAPVASAPGVVGSQSPVDAAAPAVETKAALPADPREFWDNLDKGRELHLLDTGYIIQDDRWVATPTDVVYASDRMLYRHFHLLVWLYDDDRPLELATNPDGSLPAASWIQDLSVREIAGVKVLAPVSRRVSEETTRAHIQAVLHLVQPRVENIPLYLPKVGENERFQQVLPRQVQCMDTQHPMKELWCRWLLRDRWWGFHMPCRRQLLFLGELPSEHFQAPDLEKVIRIAKGGDLENDSRARVCWMSTTLNCQLADSGQVISAETITDPELALSAAKQGWSLARQLNPVLLPFPFEPMVHGTKPEEHGVRLGVDRDEQGVLATQPGWDRAVTRWLWGQFIHSYPTW